MSFVTRAVLAVPHFCVRDEESGLLILSGPFELTDTFVERLMARKRLLSAFFKISEPAKSLLHQMKAS
jgi:hypothetical protein